MLRLFKQIRNPVMQNSSSNQRNRYIIYAIGEIILVTMGILIALQINNWNERNKEIKRVNGTLEQIQQDLKADIREATTLISGVAYQDSVSSRFLNEDFTPEDLAEEENLAMKGVMFGFNRYVSNQESFKVLSEVTKSNMPEEIDSIYVALSLLYGESNGYVMESNELVRNFVYNVLEEYRKEYDFIIGENTDEENEFFANSIQVTKNLQLFRSLMLDNQLTFTKNYRAQAISAYQSIAKILDQESDAPIEWFEADSLAKFVGTYVSEESDTVSLRLENGKLTYTLIAEDVNSAPNTAMSPISDDTFIFELITDPSIMFFRSNEETGEYYFIEKSGHDYDSYTKLKDE